MHAHTHTHTHILCQHIYKCSGPITHTPFKIVFHIVHTYSDSSSDPQLSNTSITVSVYPFIHVRISYEHHYRQSELYLTVLLISCVHLIPLTLTLTVHLLWILQNFVILTI